MGLLEQVLEDWRRVLPLELQKQVVELVIRHSVEHVFKVIGLHLLVLPSLEEVFLLRVFANHVGHILVAGHVFDEGDESEEFAVCRGAGATSPTILLRDNDLDDSTGQTSCEALSEGFVQLVL